MPKILLLLGSLLTAFPLIYFLKRFFSKNSKAQREFNRYLSQNFSSEEIGRFYERYIGHLYEVEGYNVTYNGANQGYKDLGRDLIVRSVDEVLIIQTKCWSKKKWIPTKDIFQLYGSMTHFKLTTKEKSGTTKAILCTTAQFGEETIEAAQILGIQLKRVSLNRKYPMIKCSITNSGEKFYFLPFDEHYDRIKIDLYKDEHFVHTINEAVKLGFKRAA